MNSPAKCARPACNCIPADGKKYCSAVCADRRSSPGTRRKGTRWNCRTIGLSGMRLASRA
jgi:hypothetical protein